MNITVLFGSPRKNGNSDKLGASFIEGALLAGHNVDKFYIREMNINGCSGCEYCYDHSGSCCIKDDMQKIYLSLEKTDCIVFVTPIYYQNFPSQLKAVIDRLFVSENKVFPIKKSCLLATYASSGKKWFKLMDLNYKALISYHGWKELGTMYIGKMDEKDNIDNSLYLQDAFEFGKRL